MVDFVAENGVLILILGFCALALGAMLTPVVIFMNAWRSVKQAEIEASMRKAEYEAALKQDMLNRGMSAVDIRKVLDSRPDFADAAKDAIRVAAGCKGWQDFGRKWAGFGLWLGGDKAGHKRCGDHA